MDIEREVIVRVFEILLIAMVATSGLFAAEPILVEPVPAASRLLPPNGPTEAQYPHLHNLMQVTGSIYSGGEPHDDEAFASLARLGIKVIVSVDGAVPNLEAAQRYGLRYIHIPIGYDGVPAPAGLALAKVVREVEGPFYIHCHHGKHRGPAAAAIACVAAGAADGKTAWRVLEQGKTSRDYAGLWRDVAAYIPPAADAKLPELVTVAPVESLAAAMAKIDRLNDDLKLLQQRRWEPSPDHADLVATQLALLVKEAFHESNRLLGNEYDAQFGIWLQASEVASTDFETALKSEDFVAAERHFLLLQEQCKRCHKHYRDN